MPIPREADAYRNAQRAAAAVAAQAARRPSTFRYQTATEVDARARAQSARDAYEAAVRRAKDYIAAGDVMQVVLSQRMQLPFSASPLSLYRALRSLNPSPYMFYYDFGDFHVVGASPEILVRKEGVDGHAAPDRRHASARRDARSRRARSRASSPPIPKEIAEHVMLLDLGRNDVGRVAQTGSVRVTEQMAIERYSHVMHIVSNVEGTLPPGTDELRRAARERFPPERSAARRRCARWRSSTSSSPRRAASTRAPSATSASRTTWILAIAIRTAVVQDGMLYVQAGAGIVHDSVPETEWQETLNKARAVLRAAEIVQLGLDTD